MGRVFQYLVGYQKEFQVACRVQVGFRSGKSVDLYDWVFSGIFFILGYFWIFLGISEYFRVSGFF